MKCVYVILKRPESPDFLEPEAFIKTGAHFIFGKVCFVTGDPERVVEVAKKFQKAHPTFRYDIIPFTLEEASQIVMVAEFERMVSDTEFMKGVD